jgi:hypothetical protein
MVVVVSLVRLDFFQQLFGSICSKDAYNPYRWEMVKSKLTFASKYFSKPIVFPFLNLGLAEKTSII